MQWVKRYHNAGEEIVRWSGQTDKFVHVHTGLLIWLLAAVLLKRRLSSWVPLAVVVAAEGANELLDWGFYGHVNRADTAGDIAATLAWPLILTVALQRFRKIRG